MPVASLVRCSAVIRSPRFLSPRQKATPQPGVSRRPTSTAQHGGGTWVGEVLGGRGSAQARPGVATVRGATDEGAGNGLGGQQEPVTRGAALPLVAAPRSPWSRRRAPRVLKTVQPCAYRVSTPICRTGPLPCRRRARLRAHSSGIGQVRQPNSGQSVSRPQARVGFHQLRNALHVGSHRNLVQRSRAQTSAGNSRATHSVWLVIGKTPMVVSVDAIPCGWLRS